MIVERVESSWESIGLRRPYRIAHQDTETAELGFVTLRTRTGRVGHGCASPVEEITRESPGACRAALERARGLAGTLPDVRAVLRAEFSATPAARAALDAACYDAEARERGLALVDLLGRRVRNLPTSVTLGIRDVADTVCEAEEHLARGFSVLKVKIGEDLERDVELLARLRERCGFAVTLRADANAGYTVPEVERFFARTADLAIEFLEQPAPREFDDEVRRLPATIRARLAADESLFDEPDALRLSRAPVPFGIWNVKLAKCGGIAPALDLARIAERAGIDLMWGCMDESVAGIAAALHAAYACPATRYLDLDGSLDLARDPLRGGFEIVAGHLHTLIAPGLGVEPAP